MKKVKINKVDTHSDEEDNFSDVDEEEYNPAEWVTYINPLLFIYHIPL
jgi:hypothetical protein